MFVSLSYLNLSLLVDCHTPWTFQPSNDPKWNAKKVHSDREWASFDVLPLHFDVQLVPPLIGGLVANFILVPSGFLCHTFSCLTC